MARIGHTYTRDFDLETRQHEILGYDLGEGPPRRAIIVGALLLTLWGGCLVFLFGVPSRFTFSAYFLPPLLITIYGTQRDTRIPRRWKLTQWALAVRYVMVGHRPIINGGRRAATRSEWLTLRERLRYRTETLATMPGMSALHRPEHAPRREGATGPVVRINSRVRLYGPDRVYRAHTTSTERRR